MKKQVIFKALAITGVGTTMYLTARAVPYFEDYYEEWIASKNFAENDDEVMKAHIEFIKRTAKTFLPALLSAVATVVSITLLDKEHVKAQEAILGALYLAKTGEQNLISQIKADGAHVKPKFSEEEFPKKPLRADEILVYEPYTDQIFPTTKKLIEKAMTKGNKRLNNYYFMDLNRLLKDIGGRTCSFGEKLGWSCDSEYMMEKWKDDGPYISIKLNPEEVGDRTVYVMDYDVNPYWL